MFVSPGVSAAGLGESRGVRLAQPEVPVMMGGRKMPWIVQVEKSPQPKPTNFRTKKGSLGDASIAVPAALQWCRDVGLLTGPEKPECQERTAVTWVFRVFAADNVLHVCGAFLCQCNS